MEEFADTGTVISAVTVGVSAVEVKARVSDVPAEVAGGGFESKIVRRYERESSDAGSVSEVVLGGIVHRRL